MALWIVGFYLWRRTSFKGVKWRVLLSTVFWYKWFFNSGWFWATWFNHNLLFRFEEKTRCDYREHRHKVDIMDVIDEQFEEIENIS